VRHILVIALLSAAACTGGGPNTEGQDALPTDPCTLVTVDDVEAATGNAVTGSGLVPDERQRLPELPNPCEYVTEGRHGSIVVSVNPDGAAMFDRLRERDPINSVPIDGVGDEAYAHGLSSLLVRVGGGYFEIGTQHGAGRAGVRDLIALARAALD
jgi:hypothetical protein